MALGRGTSTVEQERFENAQSQSIVLEQISNQTSNQVSAAQEPNYMKELFRDLLTERMASTGASNNVDNQEASRKAIVEKVTEDWYPRIENAPLGRFHWLFYRALDEADEAFAALNGTAFTERRCCMPRC